MLLLDGPMRFADLRREITGISAKLLTVRLRELEHVRLVERGWLAPTVAVVAYSLGVGAEGLRPVLHSLSQWRGMEGVDSIKEAKPTAVRRPTNVAH
jgi:DNA-binding HxlR family transcriptional regulator